MGSLPNLHELGRSDDFTDSGQVGFKPGPALGRLCGAYNCDLSNEEKSRILHRYSGHAKITKARSNPHDSQKVVHDEVMLEHMATYSPVSARSRYNLNMHSGGPIKRIDSLASSIGATSVRRLLTVVRGAANNSSMGRPAGIAYNRRVLISNLVIMCFCHLLSTAAFLPFLSLQSSVSVWAQSLTNTGFEFNSGSWLSSEIFLVAAGSALIAPCFVKILGTNIVAAICYAGMVVFYAAHIYPVIYVTIPTSLLLGILLGLMSSAHISFLMILTHRIAGLFHEDGEDGRYSRRICIIRRIARAFQGAHDFGLILGSVCSFLVIHFTINIGRDASTYEFDNATLVTNVSDDCTSNSVLRNCSNQTYPVTSSSPYDYSSFLDDIFDRGEDGRLCGAQACPIFSLGNSSLHSGFKVLPIESSKILIGVYGGACGLAFLLASLGLDSIRTLTYQDPLDRGLGLSALRAILDSFRDPRLQLTAPLAVFMGLEQAFIYADFAKSYVVCTLGIHRLNLVFLSMGLLQSVAACTLSMLLRTIRRYYVVAVGFAFQICLIMVLVLWKPIEDDPALFYVISAAWGVCHAIWEMISFTLLTGQYLDHWEAAFANRAFFKFIGLSIAFLLHSFLCNYMKLYLLALVMIISVIPFALLEYRLENIRKIRNVARL
uniref:UNC93-like protein n=1 Tax=Dendroctonus ponderosae TaxID=77166 RepID=A0AAR5PGS8_DENPD